MAKSAAGGVADRILGGFEPAHRTNDVAEADPTPLARQTIATARASDPKEDLVSDQLLQHRLKIAAEYSFTLGNLGRTHRHLAAVIGDVEHRLDSEKQLLGQPNHVVQATFPRGPYSIFTSFARAAGPDKRPRRRSIRIHLPGGFRPR